MDGRNQNLPGKRPQPRVIPAQPVAENREHRRHEYPAQVESRSRIVDVLPYCFNNSGHNQISGNNKKICTPRFANAPATSEWYRNSAQWPATTREIETALRPSSDGIRLDGIALDEICCDAIRFIAAKHTSTVSRSSVTRNHEPQSFLGRIPNPEPPCTQFSPSEPRHSSLSNSFRTSAMACQESVVIFLERHRPTTAWPTRSAQ